MAVYFNIINIESLVGFWCSETFHSIFPVKK